jgi:hypothetical protein
LLLCVTAGALVAGWVTGGSLEKLARVPLRGWLIMLVAAAALVLGALIGHYGGPVAMAAAVVSVIIATMSALVVVLRNWRIEGVPLLAAGLVLNAVVIAANGAMPVSLYAAARAGVSGASLVRVDDGAHEIADGQTRLRPLGDVVPVPLPGHPETVSLGDILIVAGVGLLILTGMHRRADDQVS